MFTIDPTASDKNTHLFRSPREDTNVSINSNLYEQRKDHGIMTKRLHKLIGTALLGLACVSPCLPAWAAGVSLPQVAIGPYAASGSMAGARYSADNQQYIGCVSSNTNGVFVYCTAQDNAGKFFSCVSSESRHLTAVKAMTDFSNISFSVTPGTGLCNGLTIDNYSYHLK